MSFWKNVIELGWTMLAFIGILTVITFVYYCFAPKEKVNADSWCSWLHYRYTDKSLNPEVIQDMNTGIEYLVIQNSHGIAITPVIKK